MKYHFKAITTNTEDMKTGIVVFFEDCQYLFNVPDGFQRVALNQKLSFHRTKYIFLSSLQPNYFMGFPGFYMSAREGIQLRDLPIEQQQQFQMTILGPHGLKKRLANSFCFMGRMQRLRPIEFTQHEAQKQEQKFGMIDYLKEEYGLLDEHLNESSEELEEYFEDYQEENIQNEEIKFDSKKIIKETIKQSQMTNSPQESIINKVLHFDNADKILFKDDRLSVYPIDFKNDKNESCFSFICEPVQGKGSFLPLKAKQIPGLVPKLHYKKLTDGEQVILDDGRIVNPSDVCDDPAPSQCFAFIFLPDVSYLQNFLDTFENSQFVQMFSDQKIEQKKKKLVCIYHSIPRECILNEKYLELFQNRFQNAIHILDCPESNLPILIRSKAINFTQRIKMICPLMFPTYNKNQEDLISNFILKTEQANKEFEQIKESIQKKTQNQINIKQSQSTIQYDLYPVKHQKLNDVKSINDFKNDCKEEDYERYHLLDKINTAMNTKIDPDLKQFFETNQVSMNNLNNNLSFLDYDSVDPEILFLGTVSMKPQQYRNASALYLMHKGYGILMDCAEGSYSQLFDHFGSKNIVDEVLIRTKVAFITHIHGDHQLGILKILYERDMLVKDTNNIIYVVIPSPMMDWVKTFVDDSILNSKNVVLVCSKFINPEQAYYYQEYEPNKYRDVEASEIMDKNDQRPLIHNGCFALSKEIMDDKINNFYPEDFNALEMFIEIKKLMNIDKIIAVEVDHCPQSYACLIVSQDFQNGGKIIYSGDTRPCQNFINYALGSSLVIHEATLGKGLIQDAIKKKHTTTDEAIQLIESIKPWRSILTHFSCRYMKVAEIIPEHIASKVMIAFDHMRLKLKDFEWAYKYANLFQEVLTNEKEDIQKDEIDVNKGIKKIKTQDQN